MPYCGMRRPGIMRNRIVKLTVGKSICYNDLVQSRKKLPAFSALKIMIEKGVKWIGWTDLQHDSKDSCGKI